ncbi:DNA topoisomerase IB [Pseudomonas sp. PDM14]|uniref:DNA topoisomerase IB n=1 Tax=Pseudomonas sp. PDM14 TaxID=2769288 RepID=UPI00177BBB43|nr:DNA topoisomerase IB [Pseudomonas sp. PDM14]MBD9484277.1 DNA topoisomerase IB [Pseudomonas sp. PDM14]
MTAIAPPLAEGTRPVPESEACDTGTLLCPALPPDLRYVDDRQPGIRRRKVRGKFAYFAADGERIRDEEEIRRINQLAIPPAYSDVWICADSKGHLQAVGRDARGRKQYRYHPRWREIRDSDKYERLLDFGRALPKLREQVDQHLSLRDHGHDKVMATVVALLDSTLIRVGNQQYARENKSFGLTTLRNRHVEVAGNSIRFHFRGKSGIEHQVSLSHPRLARVVRRCMELPGQHLFQYLDDNGERRAVSSADVNLYLQTHTGSDFTAKDYRTWAGTALALQQLREVAVDDDSNAKQRVVEIVKQVAKQLGNTPAICRKCYIHPAVIEAFLAGELGNVRAGGVRKGLREEESMLMRFLEQLPAS